MKVLTLFILFCSSTLVLCQATFADLRTNAINAFGSLESNTVWEKSMHGYIDDNEPITLLLITDTDHYIGAYHNGYSGEMHLLEGQQEKDHLVLFDYNHGQELVGTIEADLDEFHLYGVRFNVDRSLEQTFFAREAGTDFDRSITDDYISHFSTSKRSAQLIKTKDQVSLQLYDQQGLHTYLLNPIDESYTSFQGEPMSTSPDEILDKIISIQVKENELSIKGVGRGYSLPFVDQFFLKSDKSYAGQIPQFVHPKDAIAFDDYLSNLWTPEYDLTTTLTYLDQRYLSGFIRLQSKADGEFKDQGFVVDHKKHKVFNPVEWKEQYKDAINQAIIQDIDKANVVYKVLGGVKFATSKDLVFGTTEHFISDHALNFNW